MKDSIIKWIPIEERLPEEITDVLVARDKGLKCCMAATYVNEKFETSFPYIGKPFIDPTHWAELPDLASKD